MRSSLRTISQSVAGLTMSVVLMSSIGVSAARAADTPSVDPPASTASTNSKAAASSTTVSSASPGAAGSSSAPGLDAAMAKGRAAIAAKDWKAAIAAFEQAVAADPNDADAHNLLAYSSRNNGDLKRAFAEYEIALKINPNHRGAHEYRGVAYVIDKKLDKAKEDLAALERICGNKTCEEYVDLAKAISGGSPASAAYSAKKAKAPKKKK